MRGSMKAKLALIGVGLVGAATVLQMIIDWYQSYAYGIPFPTKIKILVIAAGVMALAATIISFIASSKGKR